jgi:hypothetical protein
MMNKTALSIADLDTLVTRQAAEELAYALLKAATSAVVQNAE